MGTKLHFREGWPWLAAGVAVLVAFFALTIGAPEDSEPSGAWRVILIVGFWAVALVGMGLIVKGALIILRDLSAGQAWTLAGLALVSIIVAIFLHNLLYAVFGGEEPFFFIYALFIGPVIFIGAVIRAFVAMGHHRTPKPPAAPGPPKHFPTP